MSKLLEDILNEKDDDDPFLQEYERYSGSSELAPSSAVVASSDGFDAGHWRPSADSRSQPAHRLTADDASSTSSSTPTAAAAAGVIDSGPQADLQQQALATPRTRSDAASSSGLLHAIDALPSTPSDPSDAALDAPDWPVSTRPDGEMSSDYATSSGDETYAVAADEPPMVSPASSRHTAVAAAVPPTPPAKLLRLDVVTSSPSSDDGEPLGSRSRALSTVSVPAAASEFESVASAGNAATSSSSARWLVDWSKTALLPLPASMLLAAGPFTAVASLGAGWCTVAGTSRGMLVVWLEPRLPPSLLGVPQHTPEYGAVEAVDVWPAGAGGDVRLLSSHTGGTLLLWHARQPRPLKLLHPHAAGTASWLQWLAPHTFLSADRHGLIQLGRAAPWMMGWSIESRPLLDLSSSPAAAAALDKAAAAAAVAAAAAAGVRRRLLALQVSVLHQQQPPLDLPSPPALIAFATRSQSQQQSHVVAVVEGSSGLLVSRAARLSGRAAAASVSFAWLRTSPGAASLAVAWDLELQLVDVSLSATPPSSGGPAPHCSLAALLVLPVGAPCRSLAWLHPRVLVAEWCMASSRPDSDAHHQQAPASSVTLVDPQQRLLLETRPVGSSVQEAAAARCVAADGRCYMLSGDGSAVICGSVLGWRERLARLEAAGRDAEAIELAVELYADRDPDGLVPVGERGELRDRLLTMLARRVSRAARLPPHEVPHVARSTIAACRALDRLDVLFADFFEGLSAAPPPPGAIPTLAGPPGWLLELLEPEILRQSNASSAATAEDGDPAGEFCDGLGLPPEILQAFVAHYARQGWLPRLERCLMRLPLDSIDFHQVAKLCRQHGLFRALVKVCWTLPSSRKGLLDSSELS
eukprot:TRINITY_DN356_c0_g2_i4.p1 TRINITY_DN356_c0_g2~~TRINITY_DN356_c0_g2_i4.p1  ORF type:complete len:867 (-),score=250.22 TRINITY_DN356_c0_g2_i4:2385-4985(-)